MLHLSITFPNELKEALDREAKHEKTRRSTLIQKAVRVYLELKRKKMLSELLREGCQEMEGISRELLDDFRIADKDSLKHVD